MSAKSGDPFQPSSKDTVFYVPAPSPDSSHQASGGSEDGTASKKGIVDPDTGEINWDCPCLGNALAPPCGDSFKAAFSCYVKSTTVPKGEECIDLFAAFQSCLLSHPEVYGPEAHGSEDDREEDIQHIIVSEPSA